MTQKTKKQSEADEIVVNIALAIGFIFLVNAKILYKGLGKLRLYPASIGLCLFTISSWILAKYDYHLHFLHWLEPDWFHYDVLVKLKSYGFRENILALTGLFATIALWFMGVMPALRLRRYQNALDDVALKNAKDFKPKVVDAWDEDIYHKVVKVMVPGIGAEGLRKVQYKLEASFGVPIEEIRACKNPKYAEIVLGGRDLPSHISYSSTEDKLKLSGSFIVGESKKGIVTAKVDDLPHMMIAGTVGGGKSVFFKQALMGLLKSTNHLQMYLIDLKGGLEFRNFASLPNVKVAKTPEEAVTLLQIVKSEMKERFDYLEVSGNDKIVPSRDKRDRIIVGIDEASVLYANARRDSEDYELIVKARNLTENIAKLSRAASIHLLLATQKVTKETIDTRIQEVIDGRMCFKLNTPEGSVRVLGNGAACNLPATPGRGIWQFGNEMVEVQAPIISNTDLKEKLQVVNEQYQSGEKRLLQSMLETKSLSLSNVHSLQDEMNQEQDFDGL